MFFNSLNSPKLRLNSLEKREWQAGILSAHCLHNRRWELHYASCFAQEWINIGRRVRPIYWDDIYSPMCHSPLSLHAPNLTKVGESQWTYPWGWCHQTQFKAKAGAKVALLTLEGAFGCVPLPPIPTPTQAKGASICFIFRWSIFWDHKLEQMRLTGEMKA